MQACHKFCNIYPIYRKGQVSQPMRDRCPLAKDKPIDKLYLHKEREIQVLLEVLMSGHIYQTQRECYCAHAGEEITLQSRYVYANDVMPDQPPRLSNRDCSHLFDCNLQVKDACNHAVVFPKGKRSN